MKSSGEGGPVKTSKSSPARGTWVEMEKIQGRSEDKDSRLPHGGRGLKSAYVVRPLLHLARRLPHGGRGLKSLIKSPVENLQMSSPARGTWVEIAPEAQKRIPSPGRLPHGGRGLKYPLPPQTRCSRTSSPARGTWVEIVISCETVPHAHPVVSRTGDVG